MSAPYQALDPNGSNYQQSSAAGYQSSSPEGTQPNAPAPSVAAGGVAGAPQQAQPQPPYHAIVMPSGPQPVMMAPVAGYPLGAAGAYPLVYPMVPQVLMSMPVAVSGAFRALMIFIIVIWTGVFAMDMFLLTTDSTYIFMWLWYPIVIVLLIFMLYWKLPVRCDITPTGIIVYTRMTQYSLNFDRMSAIIVVRSTWCWTGAACTYPRTKFTSTTNGVFFRSEDCATSLGFSPFDLNQFLMCLQQTRGNGLIRYE